tara:strand:+ start:1072 stop:1389 length:318 start_codon:yes stop_codon:yes gene_type:complete
MKKSNYLFGGYPPLVRLLLSLPIVLVLIYFMPNIGIRDTFYRKNEHISPNESLLTILGKNQTFTFLCIVLIALILYYEFPSMYMTIRVAIFIVLLIVYLNYTLSF